LAEDNELRIWKSDNIEKSIQSAFTTALPEGVPVDFDILNIDLPDFRVSYAVPVDGFIGRQLHIHIVPAKQYLRRKRGRTEHESEHLILDETLIVKSCNY
jgi:hypothetical protein